MQAIRDNSFVGVEAAFRRGAKVDSYDIDLVVNSKDTLDPAIVTALALHRSCSWNSKRDLKIAFPAVAELL